VTTDPWPLGSSLELGALSSAVPCACLHVKHVLWEWGLNSLAERAELHGPPLPGRVPRVRPKPQAEIVTDLDILRRLRDHLSS